MDKETLKKLYTEVLARNQKNPFTRLNITKIVDELIAVNELTPTDLELKEAELKQAELEANIKKLDEAKAVVAELSPKVESLRVELNIK